MKKYILLTIKLSFIFFVNTYGQETKPVDTIYIKAYQENLLNKFYGVSGDNSLSIGFFFKIDWELHGYKKDMIFLHFKSPGKKPKNDWAINPVSIKQISLFKQVYTLEAFVKKLKDQDFLLPITYGKVQLMLLYGEKSSTQFETFPVKIGTDLSTEG